VIIRLHYLLLLFLTACSAAGPVGPVARGESPLVWPASPEPARIQLEYSFSNPQDLGLEKSLFSKLLDWFAGADEERMQRPYSIAVNGDKIVVADPGSSIVHVFDLRGKKYRRISRVGNEDLLAPVGVALGGDQLFISDSKLNRVFILDQSLKLVKVLGDFQRPTGLAYDLDRNRVYVADTLAHQVKVFNRNGSLLFTIGNRGEGDAYFNFPTHLVFADDRLFVNDTMNFRIQIFRYDGQHLTTFGKAGDATGSFGQAKGIAIDADGNVYIADALANRVQIFNQAGIFLLDFGEYGSSPGSFQLPAGLSVWGDKVYVADSLNGRVQVFRYLGGND